MTQDTDLVRRLRDLAKLRQAAVDAMPVGFMPPMAAKAAADVACLRQSADCIEALSQTLETIKTLLDDGAIAMPGGTMDWTIADRVAIAVGAANDEDDRRRATSAESELTTLRADLLEARKRLGEIETAALLYVGGEADTSLDAASALIGRIADIAKETGQ